MCTMTSETDFQGCLVISGEHHLFTFFSMAASHETKPKVYGYLSISAPAAVSILSLAS